MLNNNNTISKKCHYKHLTSSNNLVKYKKLNLGGKYGCKKTFKQEFEV